MHHDDHLLNDATVLGVFWGHSHKDLLIAMSIAELQKRYMRFAGGQSSCLFVVCTSTSNFILRRVSHVFGVPTMNLMRWTIK